VNERYVRGALFVLLAFNGLVAVAGAIFVVPSLPLDMLRWGPFTDFTVPAIGLGLAGALSLLAALGVIATPALGAIAAVFAGLAMAIFEIVEVAVTGIAVFEYPDAPQAWLQPLFFTIGLFIAALGLELFRLHARRLRIRPA
jgi:hypothetical protein